MNFLDQLQKWRVEMTVWKKRWSTEAFHILFIFKKTKGFQTDRPGPKGYSTHPFFVWLQSIIYIIHSLNYPVVTLRPIYFNQRLLFSEPISIVYLNQVRHRWTPKSSICLHQNYYFGPSSRWKCNESWSNNHGLSFWKTCQ